MKVSRALVLLVLTILIVASVRPSAYAQHGLFSVGQVSPIFLGSTGPDCSQTISFSAGGDLTDCTAGCCLLSLSGGPNYDLGSIVLGTQNTFTATGLQPGVYAVCCSVGWLTGATPSGHDGTCLADCVDHWLSGVLVCTNVVPTSVDKPNKTVHYTCRIKSERVQCYDNTLRQPLGSLQYTAYAPDGSSTSGGGMAVQDANSWTAEFNIAYSKATYNSGSYTLVIGALYPDAIFAFSPTSPHTDWYCEYDPAGYPPYGVRYSLSNVATFSDYPNFRINAVRTSTSSPSTYPPSPIEPAYGDSVTYYWQRSYSEFHAKSIALFQEFDQPGNDGTYYPYNGKFYKEIPNSEAFIDDPTKTSNFVDIDLNSQPQRLYSTGELSWPNKPGISMPVYYPEFPSGTHRIGIKYDDDYVELTGETVKVSMSIYDAYTGSSAPFYPGDDSEGKTSIFYKMSAPAQEGMVNISIGGIKTVQGTANRGQNTLANVWDGSTNSGNYVDGGPYGLTFNVAPLSGQVGPMLNLSANHAPEFTPASPSNETLTIDAYIDEPVRRQQARQAKLTAVVYDSNGQFVRLLANEQQANISNRVDIADGQNELIWDGKDEQGQTVGSGSYTIVLFAKDDAGVGCESSSAVTSVTVTDPPQSETVLEWPVDIGDYGLNGMPSGIAGYTDSEASVFVSVDSGTETTATDYENGFFFVSAPQTPGDHTVTLRTNSGVLPEKSLTVTYRVNEPSVTSPTPGSRFDPQSNGAISVTYSSQVSDSVEIYVYDPFDQPQCIDQQNPTPAATTLNGAVATKLVRTVDTNRAVVAGPNTVQWDGKNDGGQFVSPGLYDIVIRRHNADGLLENEVSVQVVVEHPAEALSISGVASQVSGSSVSINWNTNASTTGYVVYEANGNPAGKARTVGSLSTQHTVWLPSAMSATTYDYYIVATNPTTGETAVSQKQSVTTESGPQPGTSYATLKSSTEAQVYYSADDMVNAAIEYAQVGPGISQVQWHKIEQCFLDEKHAFNLTGLQPNAEHAYRIVSSVNNDWTNCLKSSFEWFTTKTTLPSVAFQNLEDRQSVTSLSQVVVRASDHQYARFSTHGISSIELFIDGDQVTTFTKNPTSDYVDYTFDTSTLGLTSGLHELQTVAYDDYWQSRWSSMQILIESGSQMQSASVSTSSNSRVTLSSAGSGLSKLWRQAQAVSIPMHLYFRNNSGVGSLRIGHSFLGMGKMKMAFDSKTNKSWKEDSEGAYGFYCPDINRAVTGMVGKVQSEKHAWQWKWDQPYLIKYITRKDIANMKKEISKDAAKKPYYKLFPDPPKTHNCASWVADILMRSGVDKRAIGFRNYPTLPSQIPNYASEVNASRIPTLP
ncbi:MAG: hypothetical protein ACYC64_17745 [Armatimonadota bacterium]